jgi:hypothetical protein
MLGTQFEDYTQIACIATVATSKLLSRRNNLLLTPVTVEYVHHAERQSVLFFYFEWDATLLK